MNKKKYAVFLICLVTAAFLVTFFFCKRLIKTKAPEVREPSREVTLTESTIESDANAPVSDEVKVVRKVSLPEAVSIGSGNAVSFYGNPDYMNVIPVDIESFSSGDIPSGYDSRNVDGKSYVTEVEDQGLAYLCWTYSSLAAIESDILSHHSNIEAKDLDLSEKHLAYYNLHRAVGSYGGFIDDDFRELVNEDENANDWKFDHDTGYLTCGGVSDYCISTLTAWKGPVADTGDDAFVTVEGSTAIFTENSAVPSDPYDSLYHVQGVYQISAAENNSTMIKQMVMEHGAVTIGMDAGQKFWKGRNKASYSYYGTEKAKTANHEVVIVGWDDDYSASNFSSPPPGDGAWICKNSWGISSGYKGFFYLSYYDETTWVSNAAVYHVAAEGDKDWYDNNYQAAGFLTNVIDCMEDERNTVAAYSASCNPYGMLYTAQGNEVLKAIGFMSLDMYQQYEMQIYLNPVMEDNKVFPDEKSLRLTQKISSISGGYHSFDLREGIPLKEGDNFFILIRPASEGRLVFEDQEELIGPGNFDEWQNFTGNVHNSYRASGRSYYISDNGECLIRQEDKDFFVKAYTNNR